MRYISKPERGVQYKNKSERIVDIKNAHNVLCQIILINLKLGKLNIAHITNFDNCLALVCTETIFSLHNNRHPTSSFAYPHRQS